MITLGNAEEYLSVVGAVHPPTVDDRDWLLVIANAYRNGLIRSIDWDTDMGRIALNLIEEIWPGYVEWRDEEGINPDTFARP